MKLPARMDLVGKSKRTFPSITGRKLLYPEAVLKLRIIEKELSSH
jgi:hypothetical protein